MKRGSRYNKNVNYVGVEFNYHIKFGFTQPAGIRYSHVIVTPDRISDSIELHMTHIANQFLQIRRCKFQSLVSFANFSTGGSVINTCTFAIICIRLMRERERERGREREKREGKRDKERESSALVLSNVRSCRY